MYLDHLFLSIRKSSPNYYADNKVDVSTSTRVPNK